MTDRRQSRVRAARPRSVRPSTGRRWLARALAAVVAAGVLLPLGAGMAEAAYNPVPRTSWTPTSGRVYAIVQAGDAIYIGGSFTALWPPSGGAAVVRNGLAALDASTGALLPWNPDSNGEVRALEASADGATVYVGGAFTTVGGVARARLAAVNATTGAVDAGFRANASATVVALERVGSTLYAGGHFTTLGGQTRARLAAMDGVTGALRPGFTGSADAAVRTLLASPDGTSIAVGGEFTSLSGQSRTYIGAIDQNGVATSWRPPVPCVDALLPCYLYDLTQDADTVYAGVGGPGGRVTAYSRSSGSIRWDTTGDGDVQGLAVYGGVVYVGGHFDLDFGGQPRAGLAALTSSSGSLLPDFKPQLLNGLGVFDILPAADHLRVGGGFQSVDATGEQRYTEFPFLPDTQPPTVPASLRSTSVTDTTAALAWNASSDNDAVVGYRLFRDELEIATVPGTTWTDSGLTPGTAYTYTVRALDLSGNASAASTPLVVTTRPESQTLVSAGSTWKYLSNGSNQGTSWRATAFADTGWPSGSAQLGYGDGDEATTITATGVTHYFRQSFTATGPGAFSALTARLMRDDGAVVYLNGTEVWRSNMPSGTVAHTTFASSGVSGATESQYFTQTLPVSALVAGTNVVAVEVHNTSGSSDVSFDLELIGTKAVAPDLVAPSTPGNLRTTAVAAAGATLAWDASTDNRAVTGYRVTRDGVTAATVTGTSWADTGRVAGATHSYTVVALDAAGNASPAAGPLTVTLPMPLGTLVARGSTWRYRVGDPGTGWSAPGFNDAAWASGRAELGFGDGGETTVLASGSLAYYFRAGFTVADPGAVGSLTLSLIRDDGAAVYVNGTEVARTNLPSGTLTAATRATANVSGTAESTPVTYSVPPGVLVAGTNVIAVEVHQDVATSSDVGFDLGLAAG